MLATLVRLTRRGGMRTVVAESLLYKHQLIIASRTGTRPILSAVDRTVLGLLSLLVEPRRLKKTAVIVKPATLLRIHRAFVNRKYRKLFSAPVTRRKPGPTGPSRDIIEAVVTIKHRNPRFGCPRIAAMVSTTFGVEIDKDVVRRILVKHYRPDPSLGKGPSWLSFLGHSKDSLWSVDLFRCESIRLRSHWVLVIMDQFTRRLIGFAVHAGDVGGP